MMTTEATPTGVRPSHLDLETAPEFGAFRGSDSEEMAIAATILARCMRDHGDSWAPVTLAQLTETGNELKKAGHPLRANDFTRPDFRALITHNLVVFVGNPSRLGIDEQPMEFTTRGRAMMIGLTAHKHAERRARTAARLATADDGTYAMEDVTEEHFS